VKRREISVRKFKRWQMKEEGKRVEKKKEEEEEGFEAQGSYPSI
jgi:hypothetical protein